MAKISSEFPFTKQHVPVLDTAMAYVDTGLPTKTAPTAIFLHGNATSSYVYRNVIPHVSPTARCIVPDFVGFGDSGKMPSNGYYAREHVRYFAAFMNAVVPKDEAEKLFLNATRIAGLAFMEFLYPDPRWEAYPPEFVELFQKFRTEGVGRQLIIEENMIIEALLGQAGTIRGLTEVEMQNYRRPFLRKADREPLYRFPNEIPLEGKPADVSEMVKKYWAWLKASDVPKLLFWAEPGAGVMVEKVKEVEKDLVNLRTVNIGPGTYFLQEDNPHLIGEETKKFIEEALERK